MNVSDFQNAVSHSEEILSADRGVITPLDRYLGLRDLSSFPLWSEQSGWMGRIKTLIRRVALAPLDRYHEALLRQLRQALLADNRAQPRPTDLPRLVYVAPFDVLSRNGGATRILGLARAFSANFDVSIISVVGPRRSLEVIPVAPGVSIYAVPQTPEFMRALERDQKSFGGVAFSLGLDRHLDALPVLRYCYEQQAAGAAVCVLNQPHLVRLWRESKSRPYLVYDAPEVNSYFTLRNAGASADKTEVRKVQFAQESETCERADRIGMCSQVDIEDLLKEQGESLRQKITLVPNGVWVDETPFMPPSRARALRAACGWPHPLAVFMGSAGTQPNRDAVTFIGTEIAPRYPDASFALIGMNPRDTGLPTIPPNVFPCGRVSDMAKTAILSMADVALSPIPGYDIGSSLKISEYMAHGKPVLATTFGLRGYEMLGDALHPRPMDELPVAFGEAMRQLAGDSEALDASACVARDRLREHYDWAVISRRYGLPGLPMEAL